jgi:hypothetical protein
MRSIPKPIYLNIYKSESSGDCDSSSDEDFISSAVILDLLDIEDSVEEKHRPRTTAALYQSNDTSFSLSTRNYKSRNIIGRVILTIDI